MRSISSLSTSQIDQLVAWFAELWWTPGRTREDVERMLEHSIIVALEDDDGALIAFARAISDRVYKTLILDVVVANEHRGTGLGAELMSSVMTHPELAASKHFELYCAPEMVPFYQRAGFTGELGTLTFMRSSPEPSV